MKNLLLIIIGFVSLNVSAGSFTVKPFIVNPSCFGKSNGSVTLSVSGGVAPYTYTWGNNMSATPAQTNLTAGVYEVTVMDGDNNLVATTIEIAQPKALVVTTNTKAIAANGNDNGQINLQVAGGTPGYSFEWSNNSTSQNLWDLTSGNYTVTVTDAAGCTATKSSVVYQNIVSPVNNDVVFSMPNEKPNSGRVGGTTTGVEEVANTGVIVYPIPANNVLNVKGANGQTEVTLVNYEGRVVEQQKYNSSEIQMNINDLPTGNYIMTVKTGGEVTSKIVSVIK